MKTNHRFARFFCFLALLTGAAETAMAAKSSDMAVQLSRRDLGEQLAENLSTGKQALESARQQAKRWVGAPRARFEAAARDVGAAERRLQESLVVAQNASAAEWERARARLAADYEAYARALAETLRLASAHTAEEKRIFREPVRTRS